MPRLRIQIWRGKLFLAVSDFDHTGLEDAENDSFTRTGGFEPLREI
jgi:hypothetical protein